MAGNSSQVHSSPFSRAHHHRNNNQLSLRPLSVQMHIHSQFAEKTLCANFPIYISSVLGVSIILHAKAD